jgi:hypothetical protein
VFWHGLDDGTADDAAVQRTLAAYRAAGGPGRLRDAQSFGMYIACRLNFLEAQASVALDPGAASDHRVYASSEIRDTLARLPTPSLISHLISLAVTTWAEPPADPDQPEPMDTKWPTCRRQLRTFTCNAAMYKYTAG